MQGNRPEPNYGVCCRKFEMDEMTKLNDVDGEEDGNSYKTWACTMLCNRMSLAKIM
jgi:hypothetical protein